jgi:hypothetical protein
LLLVPVTIGGHEYPFIVDTGSTWCVVDTSLQALLVPTGKSAFVNGQAHFYFYELPEAHIGESRLSVSGNAVCADLTPFRKWTGHDIRGFIGMTFLKAHVLHIDFDSGILAILKRGPDSADGALDVSYETTGLPMIDVKLPTGEVIPFGIDSGMLGKCKVEVSAYNKLVESGSIVMVDESRSSLTVHGEESQREGLIRELSIGDFEHVPLLCHTGKSNDLGLDVLSRYVVTIDFPENRLYLQKGKRFAESAQFDMGGMALTRTAGETVVEWVCKSGPAEAAGVRGGDRILSIDGRRPSDFSLFELNRGLAERGRRVRLVLRGEGEPRTVEFHLTDWQNISPKVREAAAGSDLSRDRAVPQ